MNLIQHYSPSEIREYKKGLKTTFDKIQAYYTLGGEKIVLTPKQEEQRLRYEEVWCFLNKYKTRERVSNLIIKRFNASRAEAYRDINETYRLFGSINENNKKGLRSLLTESALRMLNKAELRGDDESYNKIYTNLTKINALENHEVEDEDPNKYAPCTIIISTDPAVLERQAREMVADVEDIDYEDLEEEESEYAQEKEDLL